MIHTRIPWQKLPKKALSQISARQRSYIDEFKFFHAPGGGIDAWYAGELLAHWNGHEWRERADVTYPARPGWKAPARDPRRKKRRRDPGRGTRKQDEKYGDWYGIRRSMSYGQLPTRKEFGEAFDEEVPDKFSVGNDPYLGTDEFTESELWKALQDLTRQFEEGDDGAGDTASSILYALGFEWI
jgi:hypothetical protein